jgi:hypothetical protein
MNGIIYILAEWSDLRSSVTSTTSGEVVELKDGAFPSSDDDAFQARAAASFSVHVTTWTTYETDE